MVIMAFDHEGVIATDRVPVGVSVTAGYYATFWRKKLRQNIRENRTQLLESGALILHDNARPHIAQSVKDVMADYKWEILPHPAYSPDMSPPDYDLFPVPQAEEPTPRPTFSNIKCTICSCDPTHPRD
jgi:hypothetical protein